MGQLCSWTLHTGVIFKAHSLDSDCVRACLSAPWGGGWKTLKHKMFIVNSSGISCFPHWVSETGDRQITDASSRLFSLLYTPLLLLWISLNRQPQDLAVTRLPPHKVKEGKQVSPTPRRCHVQGNNHFSTSLVLLSPIPFLAGHTGRERSWVLLCLGKLEFTWHLLESIPV